ncbi:hypothetical protein F5884DRAFT_681882 [Xylogone sp. PMI_703]|nr:hypothetical protein F5884DRAFT_681882 [Xylogone sp. PMI_703]
MGGYAKMAGLMGNYPEIAIFRRFGALNVENILLLQAELRDLEVQLREVQKEDHNSGHQDRCVYARDWWTLSESGEPTSRPGNDGRQWQLLLKIRQKLNEYNTALLQQAQICKLGQPSIADVQFLSSWMQRPTMGNVYLLGQDYKIWSDPDLPDLVSLRSRTADDTFTEWILNTAIRWFHRSVGRFLRKPKDKEYLRNTVVYSDTGIVRFTKIITMAVASLLPIISIVILYVVRNMTARLGIVASFTAFFSVCMGVATKASMEDIFAATAAFAAVQVVFVGTTN